MAVMEVLEAALVEVPVEDGVGNYIEAVLLRHRHDRRADLRLPQPRRPCCWYFRFLHAEGIV